MATAAARRYATAVFELATEEGRVEAWKQRLEALRELVSDPRVKAVVDNPTISPARRLELIAAVQPRLEDEAVNLARMLIETRRIDEVGTILDEFEQLADEAAGRLRATVTTAVEMASGEKDDLGRQLSAKLGKEVRITADVDPRILGGLKLQYGDHLVDASLVTRLEQLRRRLAEAT